MHSPKSFHIHFRVNLSSWPYWFVIFHHIAYRHACCIMGKNTTAKQCLTLIVLAEHIVVQDTHLQHFTWNRRLTCYQPWGYAWIWTNYKVYKSGPKSSWRRVWKGAGRVRRLLIGIVEMKVSYLLYDCFSKTSLCLKWFVIWEYIYKKGGFTRDKYHNKSYRNW